jgi:hypothetical protein
VEGRGGQIKSRAEGQRWRVVGATEQHKSKNRNNESLQALIDIFILFYKPNSNQMQYIPLSSSDKEASSKEQVVKHRNPLYPTLKYPQPKPIHTLCTTLPIQSHKSLHRFSSSSSSTSTGTTPLSSCTSMPAVRSTGLCTLAWSSECRCGPLWASFSLFWRYSDFKTVFTATPKNQYYLYRLSSHKYAPSLC